MKHQAKKVRNKDNYEQLVEHFLKRADERFNLVINRRARVELIDLACRLLNSEYVINYQRYGIGEKDARYIMYLPVSRSQTIRELNPHIKDGDQLIVVFDRGIRKIVTVLPQYKKGNRVFKPIFHGDFQPEIE